MASPPWFRLYSEVLSDRKLKRVEVITGQPKAVILGTWTIVLCMASDSPERGKLLISDDMPITKEEIIAETGLSCETGEAILNAFIQAGLIEQEAETMATCNWDKRQFTSDTSNERVARYRAKKRVEATKTEPKQEKNDTVTLPKDDEINGNVTVTPPDTDTDTDTDITPKGGGKKRRPAIGKQKESQEMFSALAKLCQYDLTMISEKERGQLNQAEKKMRENGYKPPDLDDFSKWWYENDWRGVQGQPPTLNDVRASWGKYKNGVVVTKPNGANYGQNQNRRTGADLDKEPVYDPYTGKTEYLPR